jgi:hypothetical protein
MSDTVRLVMTRRPIALALGFIVAGTGATVAAAVTSIDAPADVSTQAVRAGAFQLEPEPASARYRVSFEVAWGPSTHPSTLPPGSHTSPPVLAVHSTVGDMFAVGSAASAGIERMAEVGATSTLVAELRADSTVATIETGRRIDGPGVDSFEITVDQTASLVSLVSMLAPSPDWFVGVRDVDLFGDGRWAPSFALPLGAYDSGTDSGAGFTSPNADTVPAQSISGPRDAAFVAAAAEAPFGRIVIERLA